MYSPESAAAGIDEALRILEGRWKMKILFHLFDKGTLRFSQLERHVSGVSQKMLIQQLRDLERDGVVARTAYPEVPPRVDYRLTEIGQDLCPVLDAILEWAERRAVASPDDSSPDCLVKKPRKADARVPPDRS